MAGDAAHAVTPTPATPPARWKRGAWMLAACVIATSACAEAALAQTPEASLPTAVFPARVTDIAGRSIDVARLGEKRRVVVVTLKATWCHVCQEQLRRIQKAVPDAAACGLAFIVLSPGPAKDLAVIARETGFGGAFVEDRGLSIARSLGLALAEGQIQPAILLLAGDRKVGWMQLGRNAAWFGDGALMDEVNCGGWI